MAIGIERRRKKKKILQLPFRDLLSSGVFVVVGHVCDPTVVYSSTSDYYRPKASPFKEREDEPGSERGWNKREERREARTTCGGMLMI